MKTVELTDKIKEYIDIPIFPDIITFVGKPFTHGIFGYNNKRNNKINAIIGDIYFQILTISDDYQQTLDKAYELFDWFNEEKLVNEIIGNYKVLNQDQLNIGPTYIGQTDDDKYKFSFNIMMYVNQIEKIGGNIND